MHFWGKKVFTVDLPLRNSVSLSHVIAHTVILNGRNLYYRPGGYKKEPFFLYLKLNFQSSRRITSINISTDIRYCKVDEIKLLKS